MFILRFSKYKEIITSPQFLPVEELYTPPLNIRLLDHRSFGVKPLVGTHMIKSLQEYRRDPVAMVQTIREKMLESGKSPHLSCDDDVIITWHVVTSSSVITLAVVIAHEVVVHFDT